MATVLITGKLHPTAIEAFERNTKVKLVYRPDCDRQELEGLIGPANVLITRSETNVDRSLLDRAPHLKLVARAAVGVGNIDLAYATEKGILVVNTPGKNTNSAAELTFGLLLCMFRKISRAELHLKGGGWERHRFSGHELRHKNLGIIGLGNVGHRVAKFARGFDMPVYAYDPYIAPEVFDRHGAILCRSLKELVQKVDILSVHVPLNKETAGMINRELLAQMKPGSYLLNAARGEVADEAAVLAALNSGQLGGAALDVYRNEPHVMPDLIRHDNVYCTQHIGASTEEAQLAIGQSIVEQVNKVLEGGVADYPVNLPELGVIEKPILKAYAVLAEKLGSLAGQVISFNPKSVELHYRGGIADLDNALIRLSLMKGYAAAVVEDYVSFVNAPKHFEKMGIKVSEATDPEFDSYKSALTVVLRGPDGHVLTIGGVVFDDRMIRLSLINDFAFEVDPSGFMLLIENLDRVGVIGNLGLALAKHGINISTFALSRNRKGGRAMSVICIDSEVSQKEIKELQKVENVESVKFLVL